MVARRLLLLLAMLMLLAALAAQVAPPPERDRDGGRVAAPSPEATSTPPPGEEGRLLERRIDVSDARREPIRLHPGDTLRLTVAADDLVSIELRGLDLIETAAPESPAIFNVYAVETGAFPVLVLERDEQVGVIDVRRRER